MDWTLETIVMTPWDVKLIVAREVAKNGLMAFPFVRALRAKAGRTALPPNADLLDRYAYNLVDQVCADVASMDGKSILEIGPGDNMLTGLVFLALGARSYTCLDRFPGDYTNDTARQWYRLLEEDWPRKFGGGWRRGLDKFPHDPRVTIVRRGVEDVGDIGQFDIVCSYAVGEHVKDIQAFANVTARCLKRDGVASHRIDMGGHEWDRFGDPYLFLKFPDPLWNLMASNRGMPNRRRHPEWLSAFKKAGLAVHVTDQAIRPETEGFDPTTGAVYRLRHDTFDNSANA